MMACGGTSVVAALIERRKPLTIQVRRSQSAATANKLRHYLMAAPRESEVHIEV